jgi:hypothetical protein
MSFRGITEDRFCSIHGFDLQIVAASALSVHATKLQNRTEIEWLRYDEKRVWRGTLPR